MSNSAGKLYKSDASKKDTKHVPVKNRSSTNAKASKKPIPVKKLNDLPAKKTVKMEINCCDRKPEFM